MTGRRLGVAFRLTAGLVALAILIGMASAVSFVMFGRFRQSVDQVATVYLPALSAASLLARHSHGLAAGAPSLVVAEDQVTRRAVAARIAGQTAVLNGLVARLTTLALTSPTLFDPNLIADVRDRHKALLDSLDTLDRAVGRRIDLDRSGPADHDGGAGAVQAERLAVAREIAATLQLSATLAQDVVAAGDALVQRVETDAARTSDDLSGRITASFILLAGVAVVCLLAVVIILVYVRGHVIRRLDQLRTCMQSHVSGQARAIPTAGGDEIADLGKAFHFFTAGISYREGALRDSKERLKLALAATRAGTWDHDLKGGQRWWSTETPALIGYGPHEMPMSMDAWRRLVHPDDRPAIRRALWRYLKGSAREFRAEYRVRHKNGSTLWLEDVGQAVTGANGRVTRVVGITHDITERKGAEEALRRSEESTRALLAACPFPITVVRHRDSTIRYLNESAEALLGLDNARSYDRYAPDYFIDPEDRDRMLATLAREGRVRNVEARLRTHDGRPFWALASATLIDYDHEPAIMLVLNDISERVTLENERRENERRYRLLADNSFDVIFTLDTTGRFIYMSPSVERLRGFTPEEAITQTFVDSMAPETFRRVAHDVERTLTGELIEYGRRWELEQICKDGSTVWIEAMTNPVFDEQGRFTGVVGVARDITARLATEAELVRAKERAEETLALLKSTQAELVQAETMASLGQLVAGVAHEINTPVGIGITSASFLTERTRAFRDDFAAGRLRRTTVDDYVGTALEATQLIQTNLERAGELIQNFKQVAVDQASEARRVFGLKSYIDGVLVSLSPSLKRARHRITVECPADIQMDSYPGALYQVVSNLVMNAVTHAYGPGDSGDIRIVATADRKTDRVTLVFGDDGKGIPEAILPKIFEPFFTTRRGSGGSGLGLHIVFNLVTAKMGGRIRVDSVVGRGTRFTLDLPTTAPEGRGESPPAAALELATGP